MFPQHTVANLLNQNDADAVLGGKHGIGHAIRDALANSQNISLGQLRVGMLASLHWLPLPVLETGSVLGKHVVGIVSLSSSEKMRGVDAQPIVASVENAGQVVGDLAVRQVVRNAVGACDFLIGDPELTVPLGANAASPKPARIWSTGSVNLRPEQFDLSWSNIKVHVTVIRDVPRPRLFPAARGLSVLYQYYNRMVTA